MGKYTPITEWLRDCALENVSLSFEEIRRIVGSELPPSAYIHSRWWMNDIHHSQAKAWLDAGFSVSNLSQVLATHTVEFSKQSNSKGLYTTFEKHPKSPMISHAISPPISLRAAITKENDSIFLDGYSFYETSFEIYQRNIPSPFLQYRGRSVKELLTKKHYQSLQKKVCKKFPQFVDADIQGFMSHLVKTNDSFYLNFLNNNGNDDFCHYGLTEKEVFYEKGLYLYLYKNNIAYIGRCRDNFYRRFNVNYGKIQPINCYKHGQSTNTHMNSLMNQHGNDIRIYLCCLSNIEEIIEVEKQLIRKVHPSWNRII